MKRLLVFLRPYRAMAFLAPLFKFLEATFELFVPLVMADLIDNGVALGDRSAVLRSAVLLVVFALVGLVCALTAQYFSARVGCGVGRDLRAALFSHVVSLSEKDYSALGPSTLITRLTSDVDRVQAGVNLFLRLFLRSPFIVLGALISAFRIDLRMTLIFLPLTVLLGLVIFAVIRFGVPMNRKIQEALDRLTRKTRENLTSVRMQRAFSMERAEKDELSSRNRTLAAAQNKKAGLDSLLNPLTYVLLNLATLAVLSSGSNLVFEGELTRGEVVALVNYLSQILIAVVALADLVVILSKAAASLSRVGAVFDVPAASSGGVDAPRGTEAPTLVFENVFYRYSEGGGDALKGIAFTLKKGENLGIVGGTGAGKSTLLSLISRVDLPASGRILFRGVDVSSIRPASLRSEVLQVLQKPVLFTGSVRDNLSPGAGGRDDAFLLKCCEKAGAYDFVSKIGLDGKLTEGGANLSGGQKQRLCIARALAASPSVLLLDDSFSALDFATEASVRSSLASLEGTTLIVVSQRLTSVAFCDKILFLEDGRQTAFGSHEELLSSCPPYASLWRFQTEKEGS